LPAGVSFVTKASPRESSPLVKSPGKAIGWGKSAETGHTPVSVRPEPAPSPATIPKPALRRRFHPGRCSRSSTTGSMRSLPALGRTGAQCERSQPGCAPRLAICAASSTGLPPISYIPAASLAGLASAVRSTGRRLASTRQRLGPFEATWICLGSPWGHPRKSSPAAAGCHNHTWRCRIPLIVLDARPFAARWCATSKGRCQ